MPVIQTTSLGTVTAAVDIDQNTYPACVVVVQPDDGSAVRYFSYSGPAINSGYAAGDKVIIFFNNGTQGGIEHAP